MKAIEINDSDFDQKVLKNDKLVLVDFWAPWCGPCRTLAPVLDELAEEFADRVIISKLNIDDNSKTSMDYNIRTIPTILIFKNGEIVENLQGAMPKSDLIKVIEQHL